MSPDDVAIPIGLRAAIAGRQKEKEITVFVIGDKASTPLTYLIGTIQREH